MLRLILFRNYYFLFVSINICALALTLQSSNALPPLLSRRYDHHHHQLRATSSSLALSPVDTSSSAAASFQELRIPSEEDGLPLYVIHAKATSTSEKKKQPILMIHGSFHAAWCYESFLLHFAARGHDCYAISLRGTSDTGMVKINYPGEESDKKEAVKITQHLSDVKSVLQFISAPTILLSHSFGGILTMKLLEEASMRSKISSAVVMCSVPPSGNGPMTLRFLRRTPFLALKIVYGFVFKAAASNAAICRELFFSNDESVTAEDIERYMDHFKEDSKVSLDIAGLTPLLPSKSANPGRPSLSEPLSRTLLIILRLV